MHGTDVCTLLRGDHEKVRRLVDRLEESTDREERGRLVTALRGEVQLHGRLEEEVFFPAVKEALGPRYLQALRVARDENEETLRVLSRLEDQAKGGERFEEAIDTVRARVVLHAEIEEDEVFRWVHDAMDTQEMQKLAERINERRLEVEDLYKGRARTAREASEP